MKNNRIKISASILSYDFSNLQELLKELDNSGIDSIHADIMDGNFVPNISFGIHILSSIKNFSTLPITAHLMVENPEKYVDQLIKIGVDTIIFHYEATIHHHKLINHIKDRGSRVGIAINPSTNHNSLQYIYKNLDEILVMTVNPGFCGQKFIPDQLDKIESVHYMTNGCLDIGVDGGIEEKNAKECIKKGANLLIAGSYILNNKPYKERVDLLKEY